MPPIAKRELHDEEERSDRKAAGCCLSSPGRARGGGDSPSSPATTDTYSSPSAIRSRARTPTSKGSGSSRRGASGVSPSRAAAAVQSARLAETSILQHASTDFHLVDRAGATAKAQRAEVAKQMGVQPQHRGSSRPSGREAVLQRQQTTAFDTRDDLMAKGFSEAQADGVMIARATRAARTSSPTAVANGSATSSVDCGGSGSSSSDLAVAVSPAYSSVGEDEAGALLPVGPLAAHAQEIADLRRLGVPLKELLKLGFSAPVLAVGGFTPAELRHAGALLNQATGFTPTQ